MTEETTNHGLTKPDEKTLNWHIPINGNFDAIDAELAIKDTDANKSNYEPIEDQEYIATDTGAIYIGNGTDWEKQDREIQKLEIEKLSLGNDGPATSFSDITTSGSGVDVENIDGSTYVTAANPLHAGDNLEWLADGDGSVTLNASTGTGVDIENTSGTTLLTGANPLEAGSNLEWTDDGDGSARLDVVGTIGSGVDVENSDGSTAVSEANPIHAGSNLQWVDDGDGSVTLNASVTQNTVDSARGYATTAQAIDPNTVTQFEMNAASHDNGSILDLTNNCITPNEAGLYLITGSIEFQENSNNWSTGDEILTRVEVDRGGGYQQESKLTYRKVGDQFQGIPPAPVVIEMNAGDNVRMTVYHTSGITQQLYPDEYRAYFGATQLRKGSGSGQSWSTVGPMTTDYQAGNYENVLIDAGNGQRTVTAPNPSSDCIFSVKKTDSSSNSVTIATPNSETIDGETFISINGQHDSYTMYSNGTNYYIR